MSNNSSHKNTDASTNQLAAQAMLSALAILLVMLIHIPLFPSASFLQYDPADVPILIGTLAFGTVPGLLMTLVVSFLQAFTVSGDGLYGFLMHAVATGLMVIVVGQITRKHRTTSATILALSFGTLTMMVGMVLMNLLVTPFYFSTSVDAVIALLPVIIAFNLIKAGLNSFLAFLLYRTFRKILPQYFGDFTKKTKKTH